MAFRIERNSGDGPPNQGQVVPGKLPEIACSSNPRHADFTVGTPRNPGCCRRRLANGSRARTWTGWRPLSRPAPILKASSIQAAIRLDVVVSVDSSRVASGLLPSAVLKDMLGLHEYWGNIQPRTATVPATLPKVVPICLPTYIIFRVFLVSLLSLQVRGAGNLENSCGENRVRDTWL